MCLLLQNTVNIIARGRSTPKNGPTPSKLRYTVYMFPCTTDENTAAVAHQGTFMNRPLAVGSASGAISSLLLTAARQWLLLQSDSDPGIDPLLNCIPCPDINIEDLHLPWVFGLIGFLCGLLFGPILDLCWLAKEKWRRFVLRRLQSLAADQPPPPKVPPYRVLA